MNKVEVKKSDTQLSKFRLIVSVNDTFSVGTILDKGELKFLYNEIKMALETTSSEDVSE